MSIKVPKGEGCITKPGSETLEAKHLGSALAICISDPETGVSGITVPLLPGVGASKKADSGEWNMDVPSCLKKMFKELLDAGGKRENFRIWLVGAGRFMEEPKELALGVQLYAAAKKILQKNNMPIHAEHVGGSFDRSALLEAGSDVLKVILSDGREVSI